MTETIGYYPNDLISRSALMEYCSNQKSKSIDNNDIARFPSADAKPTVIRSKTLMPTKDFSEWAKRVRKENPNAVIIPCDAEVVSAEAVLSDIEKWRTWSHTYDNMCKERLEEEYYLVGIPESCKKCINHPSNGGRGICHCILGNTIRW